MQIESGVRGDIVALLLAGCVDSNSPTHKSWKIKIEWMP
jgi:hypothetical protein